MYARQINKTENIKWNSKSDFEREWDILCSLFLFFGLRLTKKKSDGISESIKDILFKILWISLLILSCYSLVNSLYVIFIGEEKRRSLIYLISVFSAFATKCSIWKKKSDIANGVSKLSLFFEQLKNCDRSSLKSWLMILSSLIIINFMFTASCLWTVFDGSRFLFGATLDDSSTSHAVRTIMKYITILNACVAITFAYTTLLLCSFVYINEKALISNWNKMAKESLREDCQPALIRQSVFLLVRMAQVIKSLNRDLSQANLCAICILVANVFEAMIDIVYHESLTTIFFGFSLVCGSTSAFVFVCLVIYASNVRKEFTTVKVSLCDEITRNHLIFKDCSRAMNANIFLATLDNVSPNFVISGMRMFEYQRGIILTTFGCAVTYGVLFIKME
ncbi:hypothetical protein TNCT_596441 [Trichonephila clavata]|uniref:Uncharacterized protein n=1 Tax=Trichonephila clavata TaxID=2740835 RepID=A0A8X6JFA1_TRICU|nr:hypothetical protein TNCT_596441 [Trichonephila clavata]